MSSQQKDRLFTLVKSLTKAEKRNFKLYANRIDSGSEAKFIQIFETLDKMEEYDEEQMLKKLPEVEKKHLANLKRHLYKQILISLRLIHIQKNIDIQIREQLDFARILYGKGMYMQSLKILERIKRTALEHHQDVLHLEILEFQKMIETRHITRSRTIENKMENLLEESSRRSFVTYNTSALSNFNIQIHGWYIQFGHVQSDRDALTVKEFFQANLPEQNQNKPLTFFEKVNLYQAYMWLHYILLDFGEASRWAEAWTDLYEEYPSMQEKDPDLYMRGLYYLLTFIYFLKKEDAFASHLATFEKFFKDKEEQLNANSRMIAFVYLNLSRLNCHFLKGSFEQGLALAPGIMKNMALYEGLTDEHRILLFYYKIACLHFGCGQFDKALDFLARIINTKGMFLREDLHYNARLLQLLCHYELTNYDLAEYLASSVQRAFYKSTEADRLQNQTLSFLRKLIKAPEEAHSRLFEGFEKQINKLVENPYESKAFIYLNIADWVESRLKQCTIRELHERRRVAFH